MRCTWHTEVGRTKSNYGYGPLCKRGATVKVDGVPLCTQHAKISVRFVYPSTRPEPTVEPLT